MFGGLLPSCASLLGMCIQWEVFKEDKEVLRAVLEGNPSEIDPWHGESFGAGQGAGALLFPVAEETRTYQCFSCKLVLV